MRLLYFHTRDRDSGPEGFATEGMHYLFMKLAQWQAVDEIDVIIESYRANGIKQFLPNYLCRNVDKVHPCMLRPGDVVFIRGGFKPWLPFIDYCQKNRVWLMFYGANTGRERWPFWDIVFDDLSGHHCRFDNAGRVYLDWPKPTNPEIFNYDSSAQLAWDVCIGASHIHDKKGQWRGVEIARAYREIFGEYLYCVMPGALRRGEKTHAMLRRMGGLDIDMPGMVPRERLGGIYGASSIFLHLGTGGQGDRGPMEAMACGCPVIIGYPKYHSPYVSRAPAGRVADPDDFEAIAMMIREMLPAIDHGKRAEVARYFDSHFSIENVLVPRMRRLFALLRSNIAADRSILKDLKW